MSQESTIEVQASCHGSRLLHTGRVEKAVLDAIQDKIQWQPTNPVTRPTKEAYGQQIRVRLDADICTISLDTSGDRLDRRKYRIASGKAPLRETIAAAILQWMSWQADEPLLTPMCGSGTFAIEAAWIAHQQAAGIQHDFPFCSWPKFKEKRWLRALEKARAMRKEQEYRIIASDMDANMVRQARTNAQRAGVNESIQWHVEDIRKLTAPELATRPGLIVCNPPYGDRIKGDVRNLYKVIGQLFKERFAGWRMAIIVPDQGCENALALPVTKRLKIKHGGKWVYILYIEEKIL